MKAIIITVLFSLSLSANAQQKSPAADYQCQQYTKNIERYKELRRKGGKSRQMEQWKQLLRDNQERYKNGDCKRFEQKKIKR